MPAFSAIIETKYKTISVQRFYSYNRKKALQKLFKEYSKYLSNITNIRLFDDSRKFRVKGKISEIFHSNN